MFRCVPICSDVFRRVQMCSTKNRCVPMCSTKIFTGHRTGKFVDNRNRRTSLIIVLFRRLVSHCVSAPATRQTTESDSNLFRISRGSGVCHVTCEQLGWLPDSDGLVNVVRRLCDNCLHREQLCSTVHGIPAL